MSIHTYIHSESYIYSKKKNSPYKPTLKSQFQFACKREMVSWLWMVEFLHNIYAILKKKNETEWKRNVLGR